MEQRFNYLLFRLKELNFSTTELYQLNILKAHELILYHDYEKMSDEKENRQIHGFDLKDDKYYKGFFQKYEEYFKIKNKVVTEKIEAKPLLKG